MKFLCPNCKAKYRIGPEKMVGRQAAKIRCRKCEYLIQIAYRGNSDEFDVTATPPSNPPPPAPLPAPVPAPRLPKSAAGQPVMAGSPVQRPRATGGLGAGKDEGSATKKPTAAVPGLPGLGSAKSTRGAALLSDAAAMPRRALAPLPPPPVPPIPGAGLGASLPQPTAGPSPAGGGAMGAVAMQAQQVSPAVAPPVVASPAASPAVAPHAPPSSPLPPRSPNSTQLGDQFRESVQAGGVPEDMPQDGWFVGVNGVPLGPIPLGDLRELAMAGHIDRRSLVWRDGQGEWRPLGKFAGLARVIDDGQGPASTPRPEPAPPAPPAQSPRSNGAGANGHVATGFDVVRADTGERPSAWGDLDDDDDQDEQPTTVKGRVSVFPNTGAFPAPPAPSVPATSAPAPSLPAPPAPAPSVPPQTFSRPAPNPFGVTSSVVAVPAPAPTPYSAPPLATENASSASAIGNTAEPVMDADADVGGLRSSGRSRWYLIVAAIVLAFALGAILTHLMRSPSTPEKSGKGVSDSVRSERVSVKEPAKEATTRTVADEEPPERAERASEPAPAVERAPPAAQPPRAILGATVAPPGPPSTLAPNPALKPAGTGSLLAGLGGFAGPGPGQPKSDEHAPGSGLDATAIQRTVRRYSPAVRQNCWQRALNARAPGSPSSAKVSATITVDASGHVEGVTTAGAPKGYPGLGRCIEAAVKGWQFPRSAGQTVTNVPFMFVGQ